MFKVCPYLWLPSYKLEGQFISESRFYRKTYLDKPKSHHTHLLSQHWWSPQCTALLPPSTSLWHLSTPCEFIDGKCHIFFCQINTYQKQSKCYPQNCKFTKYRACGISWIVSVVYHSRSIVFFKVQINALCSLDRRHGGLHGEQSFTLTVWKQSVSLSTRLHLKPWNGRFMCSFVWK